MSVAPTASIVIPTRARASYLDVALRSIVPQAAGAGAEVIVVADGGDAPTAAVADRYGARLVVPERAMGANGARNAGVREAEGPVLVFTDDDVEASPRWLSELLGAVDAMAEYEVFGGPIRPVLEGGGPRACGREAPPITALDLGLADHDVDLVWSANMAVRRSALERVGPFDETIFGRGEEEDWLRRLASSGGRIRYVGAAWVSHRRTAADSRLRVLSRAGYALGRTARRYDVRKDTAPELRVELRVLTGCVWHTVRRRCAYGIVMAAHTLGRLREWVAERWA